MTKLLVFSCQKKVANCYTHLILINWLRQNGQYGSNYFTHIDSSHKTLSVLTNETVTKTVYKMNQFKNTAKYMNLAVFVHFNKL